MSDKFVGFYPETIQFFNELKENNNRLWFEDNKHLFEKDVLVPARLFIVEMGKKLKTLASQVVADPRVDRSIFRIYRDVRFSKNKLPYKTNLGLWFWDGDFEKFASSGFYFHLEPPNIMLGVGIYEFSRQMLDIYRQSIAHPKHGQALLKVINKLTQNTYQIGGKHYKRVPQGYDPDLPQAELLKYNGIYLGFESEIPAEFYSEKLVDFCFNHYKKMVPMHEWLRSMAKGELILLHV